MVDEALGLKPGDVIQNTYRIDKLLGEGGMGATFAGVNLATDHEVAIKVMTPEFARNAKALELFRRESSLLRTVQSEAVIRYETTLQDAAGRLFLVMEYIDGHPLSYYVAKRARLQEEDVLKLGARLADGLAAIHKLGIVHRDIAPDNVLVPGDDVEKAKFIDFGLASDTVGSEKSIIGDSIAGKFSYMAPEQLGLFGGKVTGASDIYALGLVLLRVTGNPVPGEGMGAGAIEARRQDISLADAGLSGPLRTVLEAMLKANPDERPDDLRALIASALAGENTKLKQKIGEASKRPSKAADGGAGAGRSLGLVAVGVVVALAAVGGVLFATGIIGGGPGGASVSQAEVAGEALEAEDPFAEIRGLIVAGDVDSLNAAFGALQVMGLNDTLPDAERIAALIMQAEMYDPRTHSTATSPFPRPNPSAARRIYQRAAGLGSAEAEAAVARLTE